MALFILAFGRQVIRATLSRPAEVDMHYCISSTMNLNRTLKFLEKKNTHPCKIIDHIFSDMFLCSSTLCAIAQKFGCKGKFGIYGIILATNSYPLSSTGRVKTLQVLGVQRSLFLLPFLAVSALPSSAVQPLTFSFFC